jgi:PAS domain S-box-containing protein/putative nucleotidyltransferase with HDIG domain
MGAPIPDNETARLETLQQYQILDTPPEFAFERITALAARIFDVPLALISLVDSNRQWFKSCFGSDLQETSRELSFCAYTILSHEVMAVADTLADPRFKDHALVHAEPFIRSYYGAPLIAPNGMALGSLCVVDFEPRKFPEKELTTLVELAALVVDELELRRVGRELRERERMLLDLSRENARLATAIANLNVGVVVTDPNEPDNPVIFTNPGFHLLTGYSIDEVTGRNCRLLQGPNSDPAVSASIRRALDEATSFSGVIRNYRKDGSEFWNNLTINPVFDDDGQLINFVGLQSDITARIQAEHEVQEAKRQVEDVNRHLEERVRERTQELAESQLEILTRLARAAEYRDDDTGQHTQRVAKMAAAVAERMGLSDDNVELIRQAAPLHDVGKIAVSDLILLKPGKLTDEEFQIMQGHAGRGAAILSDGRSEVIRLAERIARSHHERWDGRGYPGGLRGSEIPIEGRILSVADVFDALTHERPYKKAWPCSEAVAEIVKQRGQQFNPAVVDAFLSLDHEAFI